MAQTRKNRGKARKPMLKKKSKKNTSRKNYKAMSKPFRNVNLALSVEKKVIDETHTNLLFAQSFGSLGNFQSAHYQIDVTPEPVQGTDANQRIGTRFMTTGARMDMEIIAQANTTSIFRYRWFIVRIEDCNSLLTGTDVTPMFLDPNVFNPTFYDWHSSTDHERKNGFKIVSSGTGKIEPDSISGQTGRIQLRKYLKLGHVIKFEYGTAPQPVVQNQYRMIILGDSGNTTSQTGCIANVNFRWYYTDN
jgi:hypothetical protein